MRATTKTVIPANLKALIARLNAAGKLLDGESADRALRETDLTLDDIRPFVPPASAYFFQSVTVIRTEKYELLVMAGPSDDFRNPGSHLESTGSQKVVAGVTASRTLSMCSEVGSIPISAERKMSEGEFRIETEGRLQSPINPGADLVVAIRLFDSPHGERQRNESRPPIDRPGAQMKPDRATSPVVLIIGGGFSGSQTAAQLLHQAGQLGASLQVVIVEKRGILGEGVAYSTRDESHRLNVPAGRMTAWPDRPDDFWTWANDRYGSVGPTDYLPRRWYAEYLRECLSRTFADCRPGCQLKVISGDVRRVDRTADSKWMVHLANHESKLADALVLAVGHRPPDDPLARVWRGSRERFLNDPWEPEAFGKIASKESVLILGSGLTAVDTVLSLARDQARAPITLLSRRGLTPHPHSLTATSPVDMTPWVSSQLANSGGVTARKLLRELRKFTAAQVSKGNDWRNVIDGLRPHLSRIWQQIGTSERRIFLRRISPYWEVHRHRMAPEVASQFEELRRQGIVRVVKGHATGATSIPGGVCVTVRERNRQSPRSLSVSWVVNCTGPRPSNTVSDNPAVGSLLSGGWVKLDPLGIGLEVAETGQVIDREGRVVSSLLTIGTLRKPQLWESTAVPELRQQAADIAGVVLQEINSASTARRDRLASGRL